MYDWTDLHAPKYCSLSGQRASQRRLETAAVARKVIVDMVKAGWREEEAALGLADAFDDYCLYLSRRSTRSLEAANTN